MRRNDFTPGRRGFLRASLATVACTSGLRRLVDPDEAFWRAVDRGDAAEVRRRLREDPHLWKERDEDGRSALVRGARRGHLASIGPAISELELETDLVESILLDDSGRAMQLLQEGADPNALHPIGGTPYYAAARYGRVKAAWPLNRHGGDPNLAPPGGEGQTAVRAALEVEDPEVAVAMILRILGDQGDPNASQRDGDSPLHAAARRGLFDLVRVLIRMGADPDARDAEGRTPREVAVAAGRTEVAELLAHEGEIARETSGSRFARNADGEPSTPSVDPELSRETINAFGEVCHYDFDGLRELVRQHPSVVHAIASWDEIGVEAAAHMGKPDWTRFLLEAGSPLSFPTVLSLGDVDRAEEMLDQDPDCIHERGPHDFALMWYPGIAGGNAELAALLLDRGADVDEDKLGVTALHRAAYSGHLELVTLLVESGARLDLVGRSDFSDLRGTPLDFARSQQRSEVIRYLRQQGSRSR